MMHLKIYTAYRKVVALCDADLIGKRFTEGEGQRLLDVKESFYKGEVIDKEKALMIIKCEAADDSTFNFVGKEATSIGKEVGVIKEEGILKIQKIPFALGLL
jgi:hypothetical protein